MAARTIKRDYIAKESSIKAAQAAVTSVHKAEKVGPEWAWYVSSKEEIATYDIKVSGEACRGLWDQHKNYLPSRIKADQAPRFEAHHHFVMGRIIKSDDK